MLTAKRLAQRMQRNTPLVNEPPLLSGVVVQGSIFLFTTTTPIQISRDRNFLSAVLAILLALPLSLFPSRRRAKSYWYPASPIIISRDLDASHRLSHHISDLHARRANNIQPRRKSVLSCKVYAVKTVSPNYARRGVEPEYLLPVEQGVPRSREATLVREYSTGSHISRRPI